MTQTTPRRFQHDNLTIEITDASLTDAQISSLITRASERDVSDPESPSITLTMVSQMRARGISYQLTDALATQAFDHEMHLARLSGEISGYLTAISRIIRRANEES